MTIEITTLVELLVIVLTLKLIVSRWQPPLQESLQAIICLVLGVCVGCVINPTLEGFVSAIVASGIAFYGGDLLSEFRTVKDELNKTNNDIKDDLDSLKNDIDKEL